MATVPEDWQRQLYKSISSVSYHAPDADEVKMKTDSSRPLDGSDAHYYDLPPDATQLNDIINAQNMNSNMGEIGRAWKRYGHPAHHSSRRRDLRKIKFYADEELKRLDLYEPELEQEDF